MDVSSAPRTSWPIAWNGADGCSCIEGICGRPTSAFATPGSSSRSWATRSAAASATWQRAHAATYLGRYEDAEALNDEALLAMEAHRDRWGIGRCLNTRGEIARLRRRFDDAEQAYREASALMRRLGAEDSVVICDSNVARVLVERGRHRQRVSSSSEASRASPPVGVRTPSVGCSRCCFAATRQGATGRFGIDASPR